MIFLNTSTLYNAPLIVTTIYYDNVKLKNILISFNNKQHWRHCKGDTTRHCAMGNVDQTFCLKLLSTKRTFDLFFSHFCDIKSLFSYLICSYMRRLAIQNSLECTGTLHIFIHPHWDFILDTRLILRSIEMFIYIDITHV